MVDGYTDTEFPEMEFQSEDVCESGGNQESEVVGEVFHEGGVLFTTEDDPIQQTLITEALKPPIVNIRLVPRRLLHMALERKQREYPRPAGLYRPGN
jgi:hypothetical protein